MIILSTLFYINKSENDIINFVNNYINDNTVGSIIKTDFYESLSLNKKNFIHKIIKNIFINRRLPNSCSNINFNTIDNKFDTNYDIVWNVVVFKDELNRNLISFVSKKDGLNIHSLGKDSDFNQIVKFDKIYGWHSVHYYKDVLDLYNVHDYLCVSYMNKYFTHVYKLGGLYYNKVKEISNYDYSITVVPNHFLSTNVLIIYNFVDKYQESCIYLLNNNDSNVLYKIKDNDNKKKSNYSPYYEYTKSSESVYIVQCTTDLVTFFYSKEHSPIYKTFKVHPEKDMEITRFSVNNRNNVKQLYCCNYSADLFIFDFESQILLKKLENTCNYFTYLNNEFLICHFLVSSRGDVMLFDIKNEVEKIRYKNILTEIYDLGSVNLGYINKKSHVFFTDRVHDKYSVKKFELV